MSQQHPKHQTEVEALTKALSAPFALTEVKFKPAVVSGNRAMALAYVDARVIQDRLDDVLGVDGWQDDYECREDGSVVCRLRLRLRAGRGPQGGGGGARGAAPRGGRPPGGGSGRP